MTLPLTTDSYPAAPLPAPRPRTDGRPVRWFRMPALRRAVSGATTAVESRARRLVPAHPGYYEGIFVQGARQFFSLAMCTALAIALGGGHLVVAGIAAIPFLARMTHLGVPALVRRHGSWVLARTAIRLERAGFLAAALVGVARPGDWTIPLFLAATAVAYLGQALYDGTMAALHSEVAPPGAFGEYTSEKTRWAALSGLALGIAASVGVDQTEHLGVPAHVARALAIVTGVTIHCLIARPFARMGEIATQRARRSDRETAQGRVGTLEVPAVPAAEGWRALLPRTRDEWAVVCFALAWGFAYGIGARQSEAMALRTLGVTVGTIALFNAVMVGAGVLGARTWGRLSDRFGGRGLMGLALIAFALDPLWSISGMLFHPALLVPGYVLWGIFSTGWTTAQSVALVKTTGQPADRIRLLSMYNVAHGLAAGVSPLVGGALLTWLDGPLPTKVAFGTLFALTMLLRLATIPALRRLPAEQAASALHVSTVYLRLVRHQTMQRTRALTGIFRARPKRVLLAPRPTRVG